MKFGGQHARRRILTRDGVTDATVKISDHHVVDHIPMIGKDSRCHNRWTTTMKFSTRIASSFLLLTCPSATAFAPAGGRNVGSAYTNSAHGRAILQLPAAAKGTNDDDESNSSPSFMDGGSDLLKNVLSNKSNYLVDQNKARAYSGAIPAGQDEESIRNTLSNWIDEYPVFMLSLTE